MMLEVVAFDPYKVVPDGRHLVQTETVWKGFFGQRMSKSNVLYTTLRCVDGEMKADVRLQVVTHLIVQEQGYSAKR